MIMCYNQAEIYIEKCNFRVNWPYIFKALKVHVHITMYGLLVLFMDWANCMIFCNVQVNNRLFMLFLEAASLFVNV